MHNRNYFRITVLFVEFRCSQYGCWQLKSVPLCFHSTENGPIPPQETFNVKSSRIWPTRAGYVHDLELAQYATPSSEGGAAMKTNLNFNFLKVKVRTQEISQLPVCSGGFFWFMATCLIGKWIYFSRKRKNHTSNSFINACLL